MKKKVNALNIIATILLVAAIAYFDFHNPEWTSNRAAFLAFGASFLLFGIDFFVLPRRRRSRLR